MRKGALGQYFGQTWARAMALGMASSLLLQSGEILAAPSTFDAKEYMNAQEFSKSTIKKVLDFNIFSDSDVETLEVAATSPLKKTTQQKMNFKALGLHRKSCQQVMSKLSLYEDYPLFISFIKQARYQEKEKNLFFMVDSSLLPVAFTLEFKLPRILGAGAYPFKFEKGFLKDLTGTIALFDAHNNQCFFHIHGGWQGPSTGFSETVLEVFTKSILSIGMEKLFRISS